MNGRSRHQYRGAAQILLALGMLIAPHAPAQPVGAGSPDVGRFYAFGGFALFGPDTNDQLQGERGELGAIGGGGFRFSPLLSFELGVLGAGRRLDTPASAAPAAGTFKDGTLRTNIGSGGLNFAVKFHFTLDRTLRDELQDDERGFHLPSALRRHRSQGHLALPRHGLPRRHRRGLPPEGEGRDRRRIPPTQARRELRRHRPGEREGGRQSVVDGLSPLFLISTTRRERGAPGICVERRELSRRRSPA